MESEEDDNGEINVDASEFSDRQEKYSDFGAKYGGKISKYSPALVTSSATMYTAPESPKIATAILVAGSAVSYGSYKKGEPIGALAGLGIGNKVGKTLDSALEYFGFEEEAEEELE